MWEGARQRELLCVFFFFNEIPESVTYFYISGNREKEIERGWGEARLEAGTVLLLKYL